MQIQSCSVCPPVGLDGASAIGACGQGPHGAAYSSCRHGLPTEAEKLPKAADRLPKAADRLPKAADRLPKLPTGRPSWDVV